MEDGQELRAKIACCAQQRNVEVLQASIEDTGAEWTIVENPDLERLLASMDSQSPDCILFETSKSKDYRADCTRLVSLAKNCQIPVLILAGGDCFHQLRRKVRESKIPKVFVMSEGNEDFAAALRSIIRAHRIEGDFRSANQRLAEVAEEHARALHESEEQYRFLLDACSDAVMVLEVDKHGAAGVVREINEVATIWFGYTRDTAPELSLKQLFALGGNGSSSRIEGILKQKKMHFETVIQKRDGSKLPVEVVTRTFAVGREKHRIIVVARSTERSAAHGGREESGEDYRFLASQTGLLMYDVNLKTQQMICGGAVSDITGYSTSQLMRGGMKGWRERVISEDYHQMIRTINDAIRHLDKYEVEYRILHKSGEIRHIEDHGVVLPDETGNAIRLLGTMKDITLRVQAQEQRIHLENELQHSQRLESLGVLAGGIAHDFNNILAGIIGLTDLALREVPVDSFVHEDLTEVLQAANRAKELVRQILAFSRQSGQERSPIYLHIIAREVIKLLRASLPPTIEIIDSADVHSGAVMANAAQMYQVITNFSSNAAHAISGKSGTIEIRVRDVDLEEKDVRKSPGLRPGPYVQLSVMDTGHGMAESVLARVFDPFFTTKGPGEGTGMGLAVVHGIITDHGGTVSAMSKLGAGSCFDAFLPRIAGVKVEETGQLEKIRGGRERILFVDDDVAVLRFAESALPRLGFKVTMSTNGEEALTRFLSNPRDFDIVITDQIMPRMSGLDLAKEIHSHAPHVPIILFTGFSEEILPETLAECGIIEMVFKPIITKDLVDAIRRSIEKAFESEPAE